MSDDTRPLGGVPTLLAGRYRLRGSIGRGGMADVQRAHDEQLDREVAVKILHARYADDPNFLLRFRREAQSAASLNHPNIVSVYDAGETDGRPFIVMELVRGRSLRDLTRSDRITAGRATEIVGDSALALNYAHEHGLIHRDIKPGNIIVSTDGEVKVTDFGIARAVNAETITETAAVFGTAAYVSPEQAQGDTVDRRTDVYSLGCVLYELLAGRQPFHADSPVALAYQHVSATPEPPSALSDESTSELDAITFKAMAKDPADRYQTARELNADLERARAGVPITAPLVGALAATQAADRWNEQTVVSSAAAGAPPVEDEEYYYDEEYDEEPRRRTGWWIAAVLLLLALLIGGWWLFTNLVGGQVDTAELPDVVGMQQDEAIEVLGGQGFTDVTIETVERSGVDEGEVVAQDPTPGDEPLPVDTPVTLTVNSGAPPVQVPDVSGRDRNGARRELEAVNLLVGNVTRENSETVRQGRVIRTQPAAGSQVAEETEVDLVISSGSTQAEVPNVVDRQQADAEQALNDACEPQPCFGAFVTQEFSDSVDQGRVIRQSPEGGQRARKGSDVTLVISLGPEEVEPPPEPEPTTTVVPDVVGMDLDEATQALTTAGLQIDEPPDEEFSADFPQGQIIDIDPPAGDEVEEQTLVKLTVSLGPDPATQNDGNGGTGNSGNGGPGNSGNSGG
jgi:beta-lactam-binding protein with PASTA domain/tRNA A-37 threonylcarbamoyl transferase component Bud32